MPSIDRPPAGINSRPIAVRPPLGYHFEPLPREVFEDFLAGHLKAIDLAVVVELVRWGLRRGRRDSCWTCKQVVAEAVGRCPRTVQSSWARLARRGWIERRTFDGPDPEDPANRTGSRIHFRWATPPGGETRISPPPEQRISPKERRATLTGEREHVNVAPHIPDTADIPDTTQANQTPESAESRDLDLELVRHERTGNTALRNVLLWRMEDAGCLPERWVGRVPRRPEEAAPAPPRTSTFRPPQGRPPTREERVRRLGDSGDLEAARALARDLADALRDAGSVNYYAGVLGEVARGRLPSSSVVGALRVGEGAARSPGARRPGAIFAAELNRRRPPG